MYRWHFIQSDYSRISGISVARNMLVTSYAKSVVVNGVLRRMTLAVNGLLWRATIVTEGLIVPFVAAMIIAFAINGTEESYFSPPPSQESCFQENGIVKVAIARDHHTYPF